MKKLNKVLVAGLLCTVPFGLFAYDKYDDNHERHSDKKECFSHSSHDGDFEHEEAERAYYEKKGVNYAFEGRLESKPKTLSGIWKISGKSITVDDNTMIFQSENSFEVGDEIYVAAKRVGSKIIAIELEQDD